ncbi:MAG TPA: hypothetical protein V6D07_00375 [Trichocoleus sp.]
MSNYSNGQRRTAANEFMRSLGQLESVLQTGNAANPPTSEKPPVVPAEPSAARPLTQSASASLPKLNSLDWESALEEAAADIEQFMETQEP